jgi:beta-mannosidase
MKALTKTLLHQGWELFASSWPTPPDKLGYSEMDWVPARVPGHVHQDLMAAGVLADPFEAMQELGAQWVDEENWTYRTRFTLGAVVTGTRRVLRFEGLDTVCWVSIDGLVRATHDNMFVPLELEISELGAGEHELVVRFESAARVGRERRARYFEQQGLPGNVVRFTERAFVRKSQYMFGWDWGPRLVSAGIWQDVAVLEYTRRIVTVRVDQEHRADGSVALSVHTDKDAAGGRVWHFVEGFDAPLADGEVLVIREPRLWWPRGLGAQPLYRVTTLLTAGEQPANADAPAFDSRVTHVGLRTVRLVQTPDVHGTSFEFEVNGRPLYALGANWIPDHSFPSQVSAARVQAQLERACDLGMNMLRIWGGGLYETDTFYDACDRLGLLVWQDFAYACSYYPDDETALSVAETEARANVQRLRNHPSLALWCGNNENHEMFDKGWDGRENNPPRFYAESIYHEVLPRVVAELDPQRQYLASSPIGGEHPNDGGTGDQHYWDVWHGRGDWKNYEDSRARFCSEFGFASAPGRRTWRRVSEDALGRPVRDRLARWHDKTLKGYETFIGYVQLHYPEARTLEEWTYYSQLNQRDALRHGIEHFRRSDYCRGSLVWQLNDCWPAQSWAVLDFDGDYKAAAYEMRRLHAPALASIVLGDGMATLWTVLDNSHDPVQATAVLEAISSTEGRTLQRVEKAVHLAPGQRSSALQLDTRSFCAEETIIGASFAGSKTFRLLCEPKATQFTRQDIEFTPEGAGVRVHAKGPVVDLYVWDPNDAIQFLDNFVTLPSGGNTLLRATGSVGELHARSLAGVVVP